MILRKTEELLLRTYSRELSNKPKISKINTLLMHSNVISEFMQKLKNFNECQIVPYWSSTVIS